MQKSVFSTNDLAILWDIKNKNTLWTTLKRYTASGNLFRIYKGIYATKPIDKLNKYEIGCAIAGSFSYISLETVLYDKGIIMQKTEAITLVGTRSLKIRIGQYLYTCKKMQESFLLNRFGIVDNDGFSIASLERAVADMNYYKPKYFLDNNISLKLVEIANIRKEVFHK